MKKQEGIEMSKVLFRFVPGTQILTEIRREFGASGVTSPTAIHDKVWPGGLWGCSAVGSLMVYVRVGVLMGVWGSRCAWRGPGGHEHQHALETQMGRSPGLWIWSQVSKEVKMTHTHPLRKSWG